MTIPLTAPVSLNPDLALNGLEPTPNAQTASPAPDVGPETRTRIEQEFHLFGENPNQSEVIRGNPNQSEANHLSKNFPDSTSTATPNTLSPPQS